MVLFHKYPIFLILLCFTSSGLIKGAELDVRDLKRSAIQVINQSMNSRSLRPYHSQLRAATRRINNLELSLTPNRACYANPTYRITFNGYRRLIICPSFYQDTYQQRLSVFLKASLTISRIFSGQREINWIVQQILTQPNSSTVTKPQSPSYSGQRNPPVNRQTYSQAHDLEIKGSMPFKQKINDALNFLRQRAPRYYDEVINNVEEIVEHRNRSSAVVQRSRIEFSNYGSVQQETIWVACIIYHETQHILQYKNRRPYTGRQAEVEASREQERLLRYVNAPQHIIDHVNQALEDIFWDLDGDGEYTHRDFHMRNY